MRVVIVGASGLVGNNCLKHFQAQGATVLGTYFSFPQPDLRFYNTLELNDEANADLKEFAPEVLVHCGALTHVDKCETEIEESYNQTVKSTLNLLQVAKDLKAKFVYLSTDYVFDGTAGPYDEGAPTNPLSVYGKHKLEAEQAVLDADNKNLVLRVTNIYGDEARGKNFIARIIQQCKEGAHLNLTLPYDQYASPTNAADIAKAMWLLLLENKRGVYHIGGTDYMNRVSLAMNVLKCFPNASYELNPKDTAALGQAAARPLMGGFITKKFNKEFPRFVFSTVDDYVKDKV